MQTQPTCFQAWAVPAIPSRQPVMWAAAASTLSQLPIILSEPNGAIARRDDGSHGFPFVLIPLGHLKAHSVAINTD